MKMYDLQIEESECGLACIAYVLKHHGSKESLLDLRKKFQLSSRGSDLNELRQICSKTGLSSRALKVNEEEYKQLKKPAILHWGFNHFVVLEKIKGQHYYVFDPNIGHRKLNHSQFSNEFTGIALEVEKVDEFVDKKEKTKKLSLWSLVTFNKTVKRAFLVAFALFSMAEVFVLLSPLYMRFAIDQSTGNGNLQVLLMVSLAYCIFVLINALNEYLKNRALIRLNLIIGWDLTLRLFSHLIKLPMIWFDKRILADILTRFDSLEPVKQIFTNGATTTVLNGLFCVLLVGFMFWMSNELTWIVLAGVFLTVLIKALTVSSMLRRSADVLYATIKEKSKRIDTIRGIQSIKVLSGESKFESEWMNSYAQVTKATESYQIFESNVGVILNALSTLVLVLIVYTGIVQVMGESITVGTVFAFLTYRQLFQSRFLALLDFVVQLYMLTLHTARLADVVLEDTEKDIQLIDQNLSVTGKIEIKNMMFAYSGFDELIIKNLNFEANPGEFIAITGRSGAGKSTFLKLLLGLYKTQYGKIEFDGLAARQLGFNNLRKSIGVVMQNDQLFKGSIIDNITFFAEVTDQEKVIKCLQDVEFYEEVKRLPMGLNTEVGNMERFFSAGQMQRLLIARALYKDPKILVLDESTSNLNIEIESQIFENLKRMKKTVVVVSHRPSISEIADKVYEFTNKQLVEINYKQYKKQEVS